jgi:predicted nucleotidyltransferase
MRLPSISDTLQNLAQTFDRLHIDYMLNGGYALPAYGLIRATVDIDIAIAMKSQDPMELKRKLENAGFQVSSFTPETPCFVLTDKRTVTEIEVWLKPDGVTMNTECLRRRKRVKIGKFEFWIIGPEDFIVNKLSRKNRRNQDEVDVVSVLKNTRLKLDVPYLRKISARAGILPLLKAVETKAKQEHFS